MKDINYFLSKEEEYCKMPEPSETFIPRIAFVSKDEPLSFLRHRNFASCYKRAIERDGINGLGSAEWLILYSFIRNISQYFRDDIYFGNIPEFVREMQQVLDSVILKAPKFNGTFLYRCAHEHDKTDFQLNEIYQPSHSLTTSIEDLEIKTETKYIITPLSRDKTRAHELFRLHDDIGNELQVNFERDTRFRIIRIEQDEEIKKFYMEELDN